MFLVVHFKETAQHDLQLMFLEDNSFLFNFDVCLLIHKYLCAVEARKKVGCNSPTQTFFIFTEIMLHIYLNKIVELHSNLEGLSMRIEGLILSFFSILFSSMLIC